MKLINLQCPQCGGKLEVAANSKEANCPFCSAKILIDDEVQHIQFDNTAQAGYDFERGRIQAQQDQAMFQAQQNQAYYLAQQEAAKKKKNQKWWILGWIFCFPIPLTVLIAKSKKLKPAIKIALIAALWLAIIIFCAVENNKSMKNYENKAEETTVPESVWATEITPIDDFKYYIDGSDIILSEYNGSDKKIRIAASYTVDGQSYNVVKLEDVFEYDRISSVIIPEGVISIQNYAFDGCDIKYIYLPSTLVEFNGWNRFDDGDKLYYGGTDEQWTSLYTDERTDLDFTQIICNAKIEDLK